MLAVLSKSRSRIFHTVEMRSRGADSEERKERRDSLTAATAFVGLGAILLSLARSAVYRLQGRSVNYNSMIL